MGGIRGWGHKEHLPAGDYLASCSRARCRRLLPSPVGERPLRWGFPAAEHPGSGPLSGGGVALWPLLVPAAWACRGSGALGREPQDRSLQALVPQEGASWPALGPVVWTGGTGAGASQGPPAGRAAGWAGQREHAAVPLPSLRPLPPASRPGPRPARLADLGT